MMYFGVCKAGDNKQLCKLTNIYHLSGAEGGLKRFLYETESNEFSHSNISFNSRHCWDFIFLIELRYELHLLPTLPVSGMDKSFTYTTNTLATFQMILGSWLTWTFLCLAANLFAAFEQVTTLQSTPSLRPTVQSPEGPLAWLAWDTVGSLNIIHQTSITLSFIVVSIVFLGTRWVVQFYRGFISIFRPKLQTISSELESVPLQHIART